MAEKRECGEVVEIEGPIVKVRMAPQDACSSCGQRRVCFPAGKHRVLIARNPGNIKTGDMVDIVAASSPAIISALLVFLGPIVAVLLGVLLAYLARAPLWLMIVSPIIFLLAYIFILTDVNRRLKRSGWFLPRAEKNQDPESYTQGSINNE